MTNRRQFLAASAAALTLPAGCLLAASQDPTQMIEQHDGRHDFDFFQGQWRVANRRLKQRHVGSDAWVEFEASIDCRPILGGLGNIDEYVSADVHGISLRLFNSASGQWSDQWANKRDGALGAPALGQFKGGIGTFVGQDSDGGRPILSRSRWSEITANSFLWEQAASLDQGKTWETNWVMRMSRVR